MGGRKISPGGAYAMHLTTEELGIIAVCLGTIIPIDHEEEFEGIRNRVVKAWADRNPDAYQIAVQVGEMRPYDTAEIAKAKRVLRKAAAIRKLAGEA